MRQWIYILLVVFTAVSGCRKDSGSGQTSEESTSSASLNSVYNAELYIVTRTPAGESSNTLLLTSNEGTTSTFNFEIKDDLRCLLSDTFLEHKGGIDTWKIDLQYTKQEGAASLKSPPISKTMSFDGINPITVNEDDHHSIIMQPRNYKSEHEDSNRPAGINIGVAPN